MMDHQHAIKALQALLKERNLEFPRKFRSHDFTEKNTNDPSTPIFCFFALPTSEVGKYEICRFDSYEAGTEKRRMTKETKIPLDAIDALQWIYKKEQELLEGREFSPYPGSVYQEYFNQEFPLYTVVAAAKGIRLEEDIKLSAKAKTASPSPS